MTLTLALAALLLGLAGGCRTFLPPAAVSLAAVLFAYPVGGGMGFFDSTWFVVIIVALSAMELVGDKLPKMPSRKRPGGVVARLVSSGLAGAALASAGDAAWIGAIAGALGAAIGTYSGYACRIALATRLTRDFPAALIEDAVAITIAVAALFLAAGALA